MFDFADGRETEGDPNIRAIPQQLIGSFILLLPPYSGWGLFPLFTGVVNAVQEHYGTIR